MKITYDVEEKRGRIRREAVALAIAVGGMLFLFTSLLLVVVLLCFTGMLGDRLGLAVLWGVGRSSPCSSCSRSACCTGSPRVTADP